VTDSYTYDAFGAMNENLIETRLDFRALEYIRDRLENGKTLAHYLLKREDLARGSISTYLPADVAEDVLYGFRWGGKLKIDPTTVVYPERGGGVLCPRQTLNLG